MKRTLAKWIFALAIISFTVTGCYTGRHRERDGDHHDEHQDNRGHDYDHH